MNWNEYIKIIENGPISFKDRIPVISDGDNNIKIQVFMTYQKIWGYAQIDYPQHIVDDNLELEYWLSFASHWLPMPPIIK